MHHGTRMNYPRYGVRDEPEENPLRAFGHQSKFIEFDIVERHSELMTKFMTHKIAIAGDLMFKDVEWLDMTLKGLWTIHSIEKMPPNGHRKPFICFEHSADLATFMMKYAS